MRDNRSASRTTRLTFASGRDDSPIWSPDGRRIVFASIRKGPYEMDLSATSGAGEEERLVESAQNTVATDWSADGRFLLYTSRDPQTDQDLWVRPMTGDPAPWMFVKTPFSEEAGRFSPDGRWVAYDSNESGRFEAYIQSLDQKGLRWKVSQGGGINPEWASETELLFVGSDSRLMSVPIRYQPSFQPGTPQPLFRMSSPFYSVLPGASRFLVVEPGRPAAPPVGAIVNWRSLIGHE